MSKFFDIIVSGSGLVGAAFAASVAANPVLSSLKILLLERASKFKLQKTESFSNRVFAITPSSKKLLQGCQVWGEASNRSREVRSMKVWHSCSDASIEFGNGFSPMAYILEREAILSSLLEKLSLYDTVEIKYGDKITAWSSPPANDDSSLVRVTDRNGDTFECSLLVGADGGASYIRRTSGSDTLAGDYGQSAVVGTLTLSESCDNYTAWQRFMPEGPLAVLPLSSRQSSVIWSTGRTHARELLKLPGDQFVDAVNHAYTRADLTNDFTQSLLRLLGLNQGAVPVAPHFNAVEPKSRAVFPLNWRFAATYAAPRLALIGDAAHKMHILAGLGLNVGLGDVQVLTDTLAAAVRNGADIGAMLYLRDFETERQRSALPIGLGVTGLNGLYTAAASTPVVAARGLGLSVANRLGFFKDAVVNFAS